MTPVLLRLAYLAVTNTFAALRLLPISDHEKDTEILLLCHQITVLEWLPWGQRRPTDRNGPGTAIRVMAVWSSWLILGVNLVEVRWWPIASAIGYTWVVLSNVLCARFAMKFLTLARQRKFSTVPPEHQSIAGLDAFRQWGPTISLYSITVWIFAILIYIGVLKDIYVYAAAVALVNVGLFYIIKNS